MLAWCVFLKMAQNGANGSIVKKFMTTMCLLLFLSFLLCGCHYRPSLEGYAVSGLVSGLSGTVILQNNGAEDLAMEEDGEFEFDTLLNDGDAYEVSVLEHPSGQTCSIAGGVGEISGGDVNDVQVTCSEFAYSIGITVVGISGSAILQNNDGDDLIVSEEGSYTFSTEIADGSPYSVTVLTQPDAQTCYVTDGTGIVDGGDVADIMLDCYDSGSLDLSFGLVGYVTEDNAAGGNGNDYGKAMAVDSSGRILVAGYSQSAIDFEDMVIWRYDSDGSLDTTFDGDGIMVHDAAAGASFNDEGLAIAVDSSGRILVSGSSSNGSNTDMVIWRYNSDGSLDATFGGDGIVVHNGAAGGDGTDIGWAIVTDSSGRILVTGYI